MVTTWVSGATCPDLGSGIARRAHRGRHAPPGRRVGAAVESLEQRVCLSAATQLAYGPDTQIMTPLAVGPALATTVRPASQPSHLVINATFDGSITRDPHAAAIEAALNTMILNFETEYTTPITVNVKFEEMSSGLAASSTSITEVSYSAYVKALAAHATSAEDKTAVATLPTGTKNPVNGGTSIVLTDPNARALGFTANPSGGYDAIISLNMSEFNTSRFEQLMSPYKYDLIASSSHEMDEVLGISSALDAYNNNEPVPTSFVDAEDLFRYNLLTGARSFTTNPNTEAGFSYNGGKSFLARFNQTKGGDFNDWYSPGGQPPEVQDAYGTPGAVTSVGVELNVLDVLGYTLASGVVGGFHADVYPAALYDWSSPLVVTTTKGALTDSTSITTSQTVYIDAAILNQGPAETLSTLKSDITLDGKVISTFNDPAYLAVNNAYYSIGLSLGKLAAGTHTLTINVNLGDSVAETNYSNNTYTRTFTVSSGALPDLTPYTPSGWTAPIVVATKAGATTDASSITTADTIYVDAAFANIGTASVTSDITSTLKLDGVVIATLVDDTPPLGVDYFYIYTSLKIGELSAGKHTLELTLNSNDAIAESDVSNNTYTATFTVTS